MGVNQRSQIVMSDEEIDAFITGSRTMTCISLGPTGHPHAVAMWYGIVDGDIVIVRLPASSW